MKIPHSQPYFDKNDYYSAIESFDKAIELKLELADDLNNLLRDFRENIKNLKDILSKIFLNK